ncbi:radical SAM protein [candidate division KSB1 bacterium]|nr:radical SAM protein [candidate division KSB1 bacterium]
MISTNNVAKLPFKQLNGSKKMDELWINTGTRCNLTCIHCYIDSNPTNDFLEQLTLDDIRDELKTAQKFGVENIYFTGGEPFINKNIIPMIEAAMRITDTTILTNGTKPLRKNIPQLLKIEKSSPYELFLRISLDHYQEARHDLIRGKGKFAETFETVRLLKDSGFENIIITPTAEVYRGTPMTESQARSVYRNLFLNEGIPVEVKVIPAILEMGAQTKRAQAKHEFVRITQSEIENTPEDQLPQCYNGRTVQKIAGQKMILPCPILYEPEYSTGSSLEKSLLIDIPLNHKECYHYCMKSNGKCGN